MEMEMDSDLANYASSSSSSSSSSGGGVSVATVLEWGEKAPAVAVLISEIETAVKSATKSYREKYTDTGNKKHGIESADRIDAFIKIYVRTQDLNKICDLLQKYITSAKAYFNAKASSCGKESLVWMVMQRLNDTFQPSSGTETTNEIITYQYYSFGENGKNQFNTKKKNLRKEFAENLIMKMDNCLVNYTSDVAVASADDEMKGKKKGSEMKMDPPWKLVEVAPVPTDFSLEKLHDVVKEAAQQYIKSNKFNPLGKKKSLAFCRALIVELDKHLNFNQSEELIKSSIQQGKVNEEDEPLKFKKGTAVIALMVAIDNGFNIVDDKSLLQSKIDEEFRTQFIRDLSLAMASSDDINGEELLEPSTSFLFVGDESSAQPDIDAFLEDEETIAKEVLPEDFSSESAGSNPQAMFGRSAASSPCAESVEDNTAQRIEQVKQLLLSVIRKSATGYIEDNENKRSKKQGVSTANSLLEYFHEDYYYDHSYSVLLHTITNYAYDAVFYNHKKSGCNKGSLIIKVLCALSTKFGFADDSASEWTHDKIISNGKKSAKREAFITDGLKPAAQKMIVGELAIPAQEEEEEVKEKEVKFRSFSIFSSSSE